MGLRATIATPDGKAPYVRGLFATIADRYDLITVLLSYGQDRRWKRRLLALASPLAGRRVLDLACGTGDLALAAAEAGAVVTGLDLTPRMIALACGKVPASGIKIRAAFLVGDMMHLPLGSASFDVVTTGYGLRNVPVIDGAIEEIRRVLRPGGLLLSLDFNRPESAWLRGTYLTYLTVAGSTLGLALHGDPNTYRYIPESIRNYPGAEGVASRLRSAGFEGVRWEPVLGGLLAIHVAERGAAP
jgi:demethylmenaquinone methyltransferase/2-methoxy-6-polyprenyl-1,4-benzoquinol methylase